MTAIDAEALARLRSLLAKHDEMEAMTFTRDSDAGEFQGDCAEFIACHGKALLDTIEAVAQANTPWRCECGEQGVITVMDGYHDVIRKSCAGCGKSLLATAARPTPEGAE